MAPRPDVVGWARGRVAPDLRPGWKKVARRAGPDSLGVHRCFPCSGDRPAGRQSATTYHMALQRFANQYPGVKVRSSAVRAGRSARSDRRRSQLRNRRGAHVVELYSDARPRRRPPTIWNTRGRAGRPMPERASSARCRRPSPLAYRDQTTDWQGMFQPA